MERVWNLFDPIDQFFLVDVDYQEVFHLAHLAVVTGIEAFDMFLESSAIDQKLDAYNKTLLLVVF